MAPFPVTNEEISKALTKRLGKPIRIKIGGLYAKSTQRAIKEILPFADMTFGVDYIRFAFEDEETAVEYRLKNL